jgi:hypothetical protein
VRAVDEQELQNVLRITKPLIAEYSLSLSLRLSSALCRRGGPAGAAELSRGAGCSETDVEVDIGSG